MLSISLMVNANGKAVSSAVDWAEIDPMVGASLTGKTVILKVEAEVSAPSVTVIVILLLPFATRTGVNVTVQFGAVPPIVIPEFPTIEVFEDIALTEVAHERVLSISEIVKAIAPEAALSKVL